MKYSKLVAAIPLAFVAALVLLASPALAQTFPAAAGDDTTPSLGKAVIWVAAPFRPLVSGTPGWGMPQANHWTTPLMYDPATVIGRSAPHRDGGFVDTNGAAVGTVGTIVSDTSFSVVPTFNFTEGPANTKEIHTEMYKLHMQDICGSNLAIRGGTGAGVPFPSFGEVEAKPGSTDFPAESFFNVFVEIDTPFFGGTTLHNMVPLLVVNPDLDALPPNVVYIHEETGAVPIFFKNGPHAGQLFGRLRLAGHKTGGPCQNPCNPSQCPAAQELDAALDQQPLMECTECNVLSHDDAEPTEEEPVDVGGASGTTNN